MRSRLVYGALVLSLLAGSVLAQQGSSTPSLYKRLGGYDAIAAVTDEFIARFAADKSLSRFLVGLSDSSKAKLRQNVVDQVCAATGGPCLYVGRDTKTAHKGLGITEADWTTTVRIFTESLDKYKVPEKEKSDLLALVGTLKADIVEKP